MNEYLFHKINEFVKERELISPGDNLLVALSGGADSVFLLNYLIELSKKNDINFTAFHVNHNLRGEESDKDELFCKELCDDWGVDFVSVSVDVKAYAKSNSLSLEESARELRYSKLEEYAAQHNFNKIVTAHNLGDNTETVLLNLFKGKGISAIAGIPVRRGKIIRPLLGISKDEIVKELTRLNIPFRTDSSNFDNTFQRNYVRNNILPLIKENINPNVEESIGRSSEIYSNSIGLLEVFYRKVLSEYISKSDNYFEISLNIIDNYGTTALIEVVKRLFIEEFNVEFHYSNKSLLIKLLNTQTGKSLELAGNIEIVKERSSLIIKKKESFVFNKEIEPGDSVETPLGEFSISAVDKTEVVKSADSKLEFIDAGKIKGKFVVRNWKQGDKFYPLGMKGMKKVSDYLTDRKIPSFKKARQLVLLNSENIVWVIGERLDDRYKIDEQTKEVLKLCLN